ncbi:MAG: hypothetical protein ACK4S4_15930 [Pyrinomonadaceae bacterium]
MPNTFYLKKGDTSPAIETILSDANGPVDLTGATVVLRMSPDGGGNPMLVATATVVTPQTGEDLGKVTYDWQEGDTDFVGTHKAEWRVTFANGKKATWPRGSADTFDLIVIQDEVT